MFSISCQQVDLSEYYVCISITVSMSTLVAPIYLQYRRGRRGVHGADQSPGFPRNVRAAAPGPAQLYSRTRQSPGGRRSVNIPVNHRDLSRVVL